MASNNIFQIEATLRFADMYEQKCRVCLLQGTLFIFSEPTDLLESIQFFGGIDISKDDTLPKYLCESCHNLLQNAILFRKKAQETNCKLTKELEENLVLLDDIKHTLQGNDNIIKSDRKVISNSDDSNVSVNDVNDTPDVIQVSILNKSSTVSKNVAKNALNANDNKVISKSEDSNVSRNYVKGTPEGIQLRTQSESSPVPRNAVKNALKTNDNKVISESKCSFVSRNDVKNSREGIQVRIASESLTVSRNVKNTPKANNDAFKNDVKNTSEEIKFIINCSPVCDNVSKNAPNGYKVIIKSDGPNAYTNNVENIPKGNKNSKKSKGLNVSGNIMSNSPSRKIFQCAICKIEFNTRKDYYIHKKSEHSHIQCPVCLKLAPARHYKRHLKVHQTDSNVICEVCGKMCRTGTIAGHLLLHSNKLPFLCQLCPYRGRFSKSLELHMRTHTGQKPYSCEICQMSFVTKSNLNRHSLTHSNLMSHKCDQCNKAFNRKADLVSHIKNNHIGTKDFECKICGNRYGLTKTLRKHERRVHKRDKMVPGRKPLYLQP